MTPGEDQTATAALPPAARTAPERTPTTPSAAPARRGWAPITYLAAGLLLFAASVGLGWLLSRLIWR